MLFGFCIFMQFILVQFPPSTTYFILTHVDHVDLVNSPLPLGGPSSSVEPFLISCLHHLNAQEGSKTPVLCIIPCVLVHFLGSCLEISGSWDTHLSALLGTVNLLPKSLCQLLHLPGKYGSFCSFIPCHFLKSISKAFFWKLFQYKNMLPIYLTFHC